MFIYLHLFHFKDEWISDKRTLNASGLHEILFPTTKGFLVGNIYHPPDPS